MLSLPVLPFTLSELLSAARLELVYAVDPTARELQVRGVCEWKCGMSVIRQYSACTTTSCLPNRAKDWVLSCFQQRIAISMAPRILRRVSI